MDRLAELEAKVGALNAEIAKLKAERPAPPPLVKDEGVRITAVLDERTDLPNLKEMQKLFSIVRHRVPEQKTHDPHRPFRGFCAASDTSAIAAASPRRTATTQSAGGSTT
jgi:hypothetical protein